MSAARIRIVARFGGGGLDLPPFVVGSLLFHVLFVAALVLLPSLRPRRSFPDASMVVDLVAASRPARPAAVREPAPTAPAEPATPPDAATLATREPPTPDPLPEKIEPREKQPEPPKPRPRSPAEGAAPAPGEASGVVGEPGGSTITGLDARNFQFAWYRDSVTAALYGSWRRPILEGLRETVEVRVAFEILPDGSVRGMRVEESSGVSVFDRSALRAVADAAPLPPLPTAWREPTLPATFVFKLFPE